MSEAERALRDSGQGSLRQSGGHRERELRDRWAELLLGDGSCDDVATELANIADLLQEYDPDMAVADAQVQESYIGWCFFVCASALTVVSAGCRRPRFSAHCAIFRVVMTRKWGRRTRFRQNNRYFAFFLAMEKSMWYTGAEYNSECAGGLHRCGLGAPLLRAVAGNVCTHDRDPVHRRRRDIAAPHGGLTEPGRRP